MLLRLCDQESNNNEIGNIQFDDSFDEKVQKFMFMNWQLVQKCYIDC